MAKIIEHNHTQLKLAAFFAFEQKLYKIIKYELAQITSISK